MAETRSAGEPRFAPPRHLAFEGAGGTALDEARLSDQQRLAVTLQGAALLSHLEHAGLFLPRGFDGARLRAVGLLTLEPELEPGRSFDLPQKLLAGLLLRLFRAESEITGRGEGRRAARHLVRRWQELLLPLTPDRMVEDIFEAAPFLWRAPFAAARLALVAEHPSATGPRLGIAGPGRARRRLLKTAVDRPAMEKLLASESAINLWEGIGDGDDPHALAAQGRSRQAVAVWRRQPPATAADKLALARALYGLGRFAQAAETLRGQRSWEARFLRLRCLVDLGEFAAAQQALERLPSTELQGGRRIDLAELAVRLQALRGRHEAARDWVAHARNAAGRRRQLLLRATLLAAVAAWDRNDRQAMEKYLEAAAEAADDPETAPQWHRARVLWGLLVGDGLVVVEQSTALLRDRRRMTPAEAGRRFIDLGYGRALLGDLGGAERAFRHALRLLASTESTSRDTLARHNLAEIRLRRGRPAGVAQVLETVMETDRRTGNTKGLISDLELRMRLDLVHGRAQAALERAAEARALMEGPTLEDRRHVFELLEARAHGWLGHPERAAAALARVEPRAFQELEPEEGPALWALAGRPEKAAAAAAGSPWEKLWSAHVAGLDPPASAWDELRRLEAFRAARLVFDVERVQPGAVPPEWIRRAIVTLRRVDAEQLAGKLEGRSLAPWRAVERFLDRRPRANDPTQGIAELFHQAGYPEVRLRFIFRNQETEILDGRGGPEMIEAAHGNGRLILHAPQVDTVLRALLLLARRELEVPAPVSEKPATLNSPEIIGESESLGKAIDRLDRLAPVDLPILILGESGTGKELAARRAHSASTRSAKPFLPINCAALSETLIQSELFGHARGAFTNADRERAGVFESARGGTVFLDEIGDLPESAQGKLLRVLQEKEVRRVGESFARQVDVRIVAATHRDLAEMVRQGQFREDLYYRLRVATVTLPALRDRGRDVLLLAERFLSGARTGESLNLTAAARSQLLRHNWRGNIRELHNVLAVAAALATGTEIDVTDLDLPVEVQGPAATDYHQLVDNFRGQLIREALAASDGNRAEAARRLGLSRQALSYLARQFSE